MKKWKVGEKLGSKTQPCYIRIRVITNRVISRFKCTCILLHVFKVTKCLFFYNQYLQTRILPKANLLLLCSDSRNDVPPVPQRESKFSFIGMFL